MLSGQSRRGTDFDDGRRGAIHSHRVANQEGDQTRLFLPFRHLFAHPESSRALSGTRHTTVDECLRKTHCILDISFRPALSLERRPFILSALSTRICSSPCPTPLLLSQIYIRHRYYFIATPTCWSPFETTSPIPVCATETGIPGFSLCPPVSVRQSQPAPCASLPPMQGQSPLLVHP